MDAAGPQCGYGVMHFICSYVGFFVCWFLGKKKKILQDSTASCFLSPCEIDLRHFHGGFPPVFNKTAKPISIHICHQFLLHFLLPFVFPGLLAAGLWGVCWYRCVPICYLSIKLGLSCLHLIWTSIYCLLGWMLISSCIPPPVLGHLMYINHILLLREQSSAYFLLLLFQIIWQITAHPWTLVLIHLGLSSFSSVYLVHSPSFKNQRIASPCLINYFINTIISSIYL